MKHTKPAIALLLSLAVLTLGACHAPSPDSAETTPADTTPAVTTPAEAAADAYAPHTDDIFFAGSAQEVVDRLADRDMSLYIYTHNSALAITSAAGADELLKITGCDISVYDEEFFNNGFLLLTAVNSEQKAQTTVSVRFTDDKDILVNVSVLSPETPQDMLYADHYAVQFDTHPISVPYSEQKVAFSYEYVIVPTEPAETTPLSDETTASTFEIGDTFSLLPAYAGGANGVAEQLASDKFFDSAPYCAVIDNRHRVRAAVITAADWTDAQEFIASTGIDTEKYTEEFFKSNHLVVIGILSASDAGYRFEASLGEHSSANTAIEIAQVYPTQDSFAATVPELDIIFLEIPQKYSTGQYEFCLTRPY